MDFDRLQAAWNSPANTPDERAQAYLMEELMRTLRARRRGEILVLAIPLIVMSYFSLLVGASIVSGQTDPAREWGVLAMLGVCWGVSAAVLMVKILARRRGGYSGSPVRENLAQLLASNRVARANVRIFWTMVPLFIVPMLAGVDQLRDVGKATDRNAWQMVLLFAVALGGSVGWNTLRFFKVLRPEGRRLERLLADYRD